MMMGYTLQWGHVFSDVEITSRGDTYPPDRPAASMGPRLFRRGNYIQAIFSDLVISGFNGATSFQTWKWPGYHKAAPSHNMLQWGHVFSDVEITSRGDTYPPDRPAASMGPRLFRRGNYIQAIFSDLVISGFNGATSFQTWKWPGYHKAAPSHNMLQWGHVFSDVEIEI